jgi:hypothetical protein
MDQRLGFFDAIFQNDGPGRKPEPSFLRCFGLS